ncbi:MAG: peptidase S14 [Lachnospiraceae bacterium]|nr:peptidase S14 [Lachnospiraceae bacterium]
MSNIYNSNNNLYKNLNNKNITNTTDISSNTANNIKHYTENNIIRNNVKNNVKNNTQNNTENTIKNNTVNNTPNTKEKAHNNANSDNNTEMERLIDERIEAFGQVMLDKNSKDYNIYLLTIIGEVEGHENLPSNTKTTKYEHILPILAAIEDSDKIDGVIILMQTTGGDCSAGLAIAEMIATLSKPTVSLIIGDSHSIGVPLAVSTDYSFIAPSATMILHPVRISGTVIGAPQTFEYMKTIQDRIVAFIEKHSNMKNERIEELMLARGILTKDLGTILVGEDTVNEGLIHEVGGISQAMKKMYQLIEENRSILH